MSNVIAIVGATGNIGGLVTKQLLQTGKYKVKLLARELDSYAVRPYVKQNLDIVVGDLAYVPPLLPLSLLVYNGNCKVKSMEEFYNFGIYVGNLEFCRLEVEGVVGM